MMRKQSAPLARKRDNPLRIAGTHMDVFFFATPLAARYSKGEESSTGQFS
jgi:hypothetical protein